MRLWTTLLILAALVTGCAPGGGSAAVPSSKTSASSSRTATPSSLASPSPSELRAPGPLKFNVQALAQGLEAPWALDFAKDGSVWFTERAGRVRVIRGGQLLPDPALQVNVVNRPGCEGGLLGLVMKEPDAFLYYTYSGGGGNTNRVSRFTVSGDHLVNEHVLLDGIPGGTCYHFGGRLKMGPDGRLYATTGEGFIASRAASPSNLSGKILSLNVDGSGQTVFAWGFRNPQGIAFDPSGRLYASNNGPTGDLGLCCHDAVYFVEQGKFYGWPAWAANLRTGYSAAGLPGLTPPIAESGTSVWAPSGMTFYTPNEGERATLLVTELSGRSLRRLVLDPADPAKVTAQEIVLEGYGRLRDVVAGPDHCAYVLTSNRDGRGSPGPADDQVLRLCPAAA